MKQLRITKLVAYKLGLCDTEHTGYVQYIDDETHEHRIDVYKKGECIERYRFESDEEFDRKIEELKNTEE